MFVYPQAFEIFALLRSRHPSIFIVAMAPIQEVADLLKNLDQKPIVSTIEKVLAILESHNHAYRQSIPPSQIVPHPVNRDGYGLSSVEVHSLGKDIAKVGWSWQACSHAVAIEDRPDGAYAKFGSDLCRSNRNFAPLDQSVIKYASLSCSHTSHWLACVSHKMPCDDPSLSIDGRYSPPNIIDAHPEMEEALNKGLRWLVLKHWVADDYPTLLSAIQKAKNSINSIQRRESEIQLLLRIQSEIDEVGSKHSDEESPTSHINWKSLEAHLKRRQVVATDDIPVFVEFVKKWGGGVGGKFIADLHRFHAAYVPSGRIIQNQTFEALNKLAEKLSIDDLCPFFVIAVIKAQGFCDQSKVVHNVCRLITASDIGNLSNSRLSAMLNAEKVLAKGYKMCTGLTANQPMTRHNHKNVLFFKLPPPSPPPPPPLPPPPTPPPTPPPPAPAPSPATAQGGPKEASPDLVYI